MIKILNLTLSFLTAFTAYAQNNPEKRPVSITGEDGRIIEYDRLITQTESGYRVEDFYKNTRQLAEMALCKDFPDYNHFFKHGPFKSYYENGRLKDEGAYFQNRYKGLRHEYFENGQLYKKSNYVWQGNDVRYYVNEVWDQAGNPLVKDGTGKAREITIDGIEEGNYRGGGKDSVWTGNYKNGKPWYTEVYRSGKLLEGTSYDTDGRETNYTQLFEPAEFKGGAKKYAEFIGRNIKHPSENKTDVVVRVMFLIEKDGRVNEAFMADKYSSAANNEAIRMAMITSGKWIPGKIRGIPQRVIYTLGLTLTQPQKKRLYGS